MGAHVSSWSFSGGVSLLLATQKKLFKSNIKHVKISSNIKEDQYYKIYLSGDSRQLLEFFQGGSLLLPTQTNSSKRNIKHVDILSNIKENQYHKIDLSGDSRQLLEFPWVWAPALSHTNKVI